MNCICDLGACASRCLDGTAYHCTDCGGLIVTGETCPLCNTLGSGRSRAFFPWGGSQSPPILAQQSCAFSDPMECTLTLLPQSQCSHCTGATDLVYDERWEIKDYAQKEFTDLNGDIARQGHLTEPEVPVGSVHPREIYPANGTTMKIKAKVRVYDHA